MDRSPIFFWALFFLVGCSFTLAFHPIYFLPLGILLFFTKQKVSSLIFCLAGVGFAFFRYPNFGIDNLEGKGIFVLHSIRPTQSPFQRTIAIKGKLTSFATEEKIYFNIPCVVFAKTLPTSGKKWIVEGKLNRGMFKLKKNTSWEPIDHSFSPANIRYRCKEMVRKYFHKRCSDSRVKHFFASMATGDTDDRLLAMEFRKLGLGHILAISGFHFALVAAMIGTFFRLFLSPKLAYSLLLSILTIYFLYLGPSPSVLRSYTMISLYILGLLLRRSTQSMNILGTALLLELILEPASISDVGFQLSYLAIFGLVIFYRSFNHGLTFFLPQRTFSEAKKLSRIDQHGVILSNSIRQGLALNFSAHLTTLPIVLYTFHVFPLLSIPYNLLFPPLLGVSLLFIPLGCLLPPLAYLNAKYTGFLLKLIATPPEILNYTVLSSSFPFSTLICILTLICSLGLTLWARHDKIAS